MAMQRSEAREIRGRILKILEINYPEGVSDRIISLTLNDINYAVNPGVLAGYLEYLAEKGYVENNEIDNHELNMQMRISKLTAKGKDLLEGNIDQDVGVSL
ncbi:MAG: hypothetical protein QMC95_06475 [Desulfitobacteriaceae bacterium]|nr:hypothetical protein [Desulfitobacteriaceae bacterium]